MKKFLIKISLFITIFFYGLNTADAVIQGWVPPDDYGETDSYEMGLELNDEINVIEIQKEEMSMEDIFGSEQVFPFPPGLGN
tara:strand:+ start:70 stop:315 length:246 start_codon:yes stop_codon:yes gene_type:complete